MRMFRTMAAFSLFLAAPVPAQEPATKPSPSCTDDSMIDRCDAGQQARVRALFEVRPVEEHLAAGDQLRRVFYVDGYGSDLAVITFIRPRGADPRLEVRFPKGREGDAWKPLEAAMSKAAWDETIERSELFDRALAPRGARGEAPICLHSWVYTVEAADPALGGAPQRLRRKTGNACHDDLVQAYATEVQRAAVQLLPACALLDPRQHRNEATLLLTCARLEGDRMAAAEAVNRADLLAAINGAADAGRAQGVFGYNATIDWNGERIGGDRNGAMAGWLQRIVGESYARLTIRRVVGEAADRVRIEGELNRRVGTGTGERTESAPVTLHMETSHPRGDFIVARAVVGAFAPLRLR